jgi:hypothetical protein
LKQAFDFIYKAALKHYPDALVDTGIGSSAGVLILVLQDSER